MNYTQSIIEFSVGPFPESSISARESELSSEDFHLLSTAAEWVENNIALELQKTPGRKEPVCPFVPMAIEKGTLYLMVVNLPRDAGIDELSEAVYELADIYESLSPDEGDQSYLFKSLVAVFPGVNGQLIYDAGHSSNWVKEALLKRNIELGDFFPTHPWGSSWDENFHAQRSPFSAFVFRPFVEADWESVSMIPRYRRIYLKRFGKTPERYKNQCPSNRFRKRMIYWKGFIRDIVKPPKRRKR